MIHDRYTALDNNTFRRKWTTYLGCICFQRDYVWYRNSGTREMIQRLGVLAVLAGLISSTHLPAPVHLKPCFQGILHPLQAATDPECPPCSWWIGIPASRKFINTKGINVMSGVIHFLTLTYFPLRMFWFFHEPCWKLLLLWFFS